MRYGEQLGYAAGLTIAGLGTMGSGVAGHEVGQLFNDAPMSDKIMAESTITDAQRDYLGFADRAQGCKKIALVGILDGKIELDDTGQGGRPNLSGPQQIEKAVAGRCPEVIEGHPTDAEIVLFRRTADSFKARRIAQEERDRLAGTTEYSPVERAISITIGGFLGGVASAALGFIVYNRGKRSARRATAAPIKK